MTEKKIGEERDQENPDQEGGCQRGKKELSNPTIDGHVVNPSLTRTVKMGRAFVLNILTMSVCLTYLQYSVKFNSMQNRL